MSRAGNRVLTCFRQTARKTWEGKIRSQEFTNWDAALTKIGAHCYSQTGRDRDSTRRTEHTSTWLSRPSRPNRRMLCFFGAVPVSSCVAVAMCSNFICTQRTCKGLLCLTQSALWCHYGTCTYTYIDTSSFRLYLMFQCCCDWDSTMYVAPVVQWERCKVVGPLMGLNLNNQPPTAELISSAHNSGFPLLCDRE